MAVPAAGTKAVSARSCSMLTYPIRLLPGEQGKVIAMFPDVPEAVSEGPGEDEAVEIGRAHV